MNIDDFIELIKTKKSLIEADYVKITDYFNKLYSLGQLDALQDLLLELEKIKTKEA